MRERVLFPDTMIFLHYQPIEQIPWLEIFGADRVVIALGRSVVQELDKYKDTGSKQLRDRSRRALNLIYEGSNGVEPRPGVTIHFCARAPTIDFAEHGLDPRVSDDQLLAAVLEYKREAPSAEVALVTHDVGPRLKAKPLGLEVERLPGKYELAPRPDTHELELQELRAQLARYEGASPKICLTFANGGSVLRAALPPWEELTDEWVEAEIQRIRDRHPQHVTPERTPATTPFSNLASFTALALLDPEEIKRYNHEVETFYSEYDSYLRLNHAQVVARARSLELGIHLVNEGSLPAEDIDVHLHLPDGFTVAEQAPEQPNPPTPPRGPRTAMERMLDSIPHPATYIPPFDFDLPGGALPRNVSSPTIRDTSSYDVEIVVGSLKHAFREPVGPLWITFGASDDLRPFRIDYELIAGNVPGVIEGKLNVVVEASD